LTEPVVVLGLPEDDDLFLFGLTAFRNFCLQKNVRNSMANLTKTRTVTC